MEIYKWHRYWRPRLCQDIKDRGLHKLRFQHSHSARCERCTAQQKRFHVNREAEWAAGLGRGDRAEHAKGHEVQRIERRLGAAFNIQFIELDAPQRTHTSPSRPTHYTPSSLNALSLALARPLCSHLVQVGGGRRGGGGAGGTDDE